MFHYALTTTRNHKLHPSSSLIPQSRSPCRHRPLRRPETEPRTGPVAERPRLRASTAAQCDGRPLGAKLAALRSVTFTAPFTRKGPLSRAVIFVWSPMLRLLALAVSRMVHSLTININKILVLIDKLDFLRYGSGKRWKEMVGEGTVGSGVFASTRGWFATQQRREGRTVEELAREPRYPRLRLPAGCLGAGPPGGLASRRGFAHGVGGGIGLRAPRRR